jgi:hypothetical protein
MMGRQTVDQSQLFYLFNLEKRVPERHLLRRINPTMTGILGEFRERLEPFYSEIGRPSIELMIRMLIVGYCYGIRISSATFSTPSTLSGHRPPRLFASRDASFDHLVGAEHQTHWQIQVQAFGRS